MMKRLSYVIVTHNRREALLRTLERLHVHTPLPPDQWECSVVDNASNDGTSNDVRELFPQVKLMRRPRNEGVWARSYAFPGAEGQYIVLLDDDSYPVGDAVTQSMAYLDATPDCGAVVGRVELPNGSLEACAMPAVMLSGAVCIRKRVLDEVGGFRREFFRKAGEYDLSFRMWQAGHRVERFEDVVYRHDKVMTGRSNALAHRMDLRNNLILVHRYLPRALRPIYRDDWSRRYRALAAHAGYGRAATRAMREARWWALREMVRGRETLGEAALEAVFNFQEQARLVAQWAQAHAIRRVVLADFSKNLYASWRACRETGLHMSVVADSHPAFARMNYRGLPIAPDDAVALQKPDGIVLTNVNPAQVDRRLQQLRARFDLPMLRLWQPRAIGEALARPAASAPAAGDVISSLASPRKLAS